MSDTGLPKTHLLRFHVVDRATNNSVAAFIDSLTARLWALEYEPKVNRTLGVTDVDTGEIIS